MSTRDVIKLVENLARNRSFREVFADMCSVTICCFAHGTMEERYLEVMSRYTPEQVRGDWPALIGTLLAVYEHGITADGAWIDPLGDAFMESGSKWSSSSMGQFFTPNAICDLLARMSYDSEPAGYIKVNDCACGSGRTLLAHSRLHPNNQLQCRYYASDLDRLCVDMCAVNFLLHGLSGYVIHANTLSLETFGGYRTYLGQTGLGIRRLSAAQAKAVLVGRGAKREDIKPTPIVHPQPAPAVQGVLF